tara:strand:- start:22 stop:327 length:306 start_codon:yes stop_codon:yes gene_type:complete
MTIIEYILDPQDQSRFYIPKTIPSYVTDGGYWVNPDGSEKMIGVGLDGSVPNSIETFTLAELQARQRAIHAKSPMTVSPEDDTELNDTQVDAVIKAWVDAR